MPHKGNNFYFRTIEHTECTTQKEQCPYQDHRTHRIYHTKGTVSIQDHRTHRMYHTKGTVPYQDHRTHGIYYTKGTVPYQDHRNTDAKKTITIKKIKLKK